METVANPIQSSTGLGFLETLRAFSRENCDRILDTAYKFRQWERENIATGKAAEEQRRQHRESLDALLKGVKWMVAISGHPDSFERPFHRNFEVLADQLQYSWDTFYSPPTESEIEEADRLLKKIFPE